MIRPKTADRHEAANASAAAQILRNRASHPLVMLLWAEACLQRQRAERAEQVAIVATTATAPP